MDSSEKFYIALVGDIMDGFSSFRWKGQSFYVKHHGFRSQAEILNNFEKFKQESIEKGIPTENEAIEIAKKLGDWSDQKEEYLKKQEEKIDSLYKAAHKMRIPSQRSAQIKIAEKINSEIKELKKDRGLLVEHTAENIAYARSNNKFMEKILFKNEDLTNSVLMDESISESVFLEIRAEQSNHYSQYSDENISKAVLMDFFQPYLAFSDSPNEMFGKPAYMLTVFQMKLITYAKLFHEILSNNPDIPDLIRKDPDAIIQFVNAKQEGEKSTHDFSRRRKNEDKGATAYFGAEKEDLDKMKQSGERVISLSEEVKKAGGKMDMNQMMKLFGAEEKNS